MKKWIKNKINNFLNNRNYYKLSEIQICGWCSLCGNIIYEPFPVAWPYGLCNGCLNGTIQDAMDKIKEYKL